MKKTISILIILFVLFIACSRFLSVLQPGIAQINSMFDVPITFALNPSDDSDMGSSYWAKVGYLAIQIPEGWSVEDSIPYSGVHNGAFEYSEIATESMTSLIPPRQGYYWWASVSNSVDNLSEGNISFIPKIHTGNQAGLYFLDYYMAKRLDSLSVNFQTKSTGHPISIDLPTQSTVTNINDSGPGSLREALPSVANNGEITFDLNYPATIVLDNQLVVRHKVTINGPKDSDLVISGNDSTNIFYIDNKADVHINNISLTQGIGVYDSTWNVYAGSAIYCIGKLNLDRVRLYRNQGAVVYTTGDIISANSVGYLFANKCTIVNNDGIGIYLQGAGGATVVNSILWGNEYNISNQGLSAVIVYYSLSGGEGWAEEEGSPVFADITHDDYSLLEGSPGIDAGISTLVIEGDTVLAMSPMEYLGDNPDMGAYEFDPGITSLKNPSISVEYVLKQNYPNPFNPETVINYQLSKTSDVELVVYNILGEKIATLVSEKKFVGYHSETFNASNLASGVYLYTLKAGEHISHKKMLLLK